jgi:hypothetical protein
MRLPDGNPLPDGQESLFDVEQPPAVALADRFVISPFSTLDRRSGEWQDRRRKWLSLGIQSELGRSDNLVYTLTGPDSHIWEGNPFGAMSGSSIFDPVVCELAYRWFSPIGARVIDPFAGGSVRGIVASILGRRYTGIELRDEQVRANYGQMHLAQTPAPIWVHGDARELAALYPKGEADLVFSCPPYADLERYSDDPRDLSTMPYPKFAQAHAEVIQQSVDCLADNRFAVWVISDVRDKATGLYHGLVADTIAAFQWAGAGLYNDLIMIDQVGTGAVRAPLTFGSHRKVIRLHQHVLVFCKGDPKAAAAVCKAEAQGDFVPGTSGEPAAARLPEGPTAQ